MTVCKLWGVKIKVNWLFLVVIFLFALVGELTQALIAFTAVFLHELGHVFAAYRVGMKIKEIEFLPFGGAAIYEGLLEVNPRAERTVAFAGPMVNFVLVALTVLLTRYGILSVDTALIFISCNLQIGLFNLIPALPLDGGRILRSILAMQSGYRQATQLTLYATRFITLIAGVWTFVNWLTGKGNFLSLITAFFVYFAAIKEEERSIFVLMKYLTRKKMLLNEMQMVPLQEYIVMGETMLANVVKAISPRSFARFFVCDKDYQILGKLTEIEVIDAFFVEGKNIPIKELLSK